MMAHDILIVDDESDIRLLTAGILQDEGYQTRDASDSNSALDAIQSRQPSLVLLDIWLEGSPIDGMEVLQEIRDTHPIVPVVMISGHGNIETAVSAINMGASDFIEKPFTADRLILVVKRTIETAKLRRENEELRLRAGTNDELVGDSTAICQLRQSIFKVAPTNSRVLITGPAGAGKGVVARLIHAHSNRTAGPFISLNCATMQPGDFEINLFGHEANTGRGPREIGTFEQAHMGTLFLDEVADMPIETQGKIVRALQEQTFQRVGGATRIEVDVRVIASSSKDLGIEMSEGRLREDLFYRLSVVPIAVPPLKDCREDISTLITHFMRQLAINNGQNPRVLSEEALAALQSYGWPGNVRELRNVIERILIMAPDDSTPIRAESIPNEIGNSLPKSKSFREQMDVLGLPLREAREIFEREYLESQISRFGGNISRTATFIGMERSALHRKLKSLGVQSDDRIRAAND